jgi:hypothetical protein
MRLGIWLGADKGKFLMEESGVLKMTGIIIDYSIWDDTIHLSTVKFHKQYNVYPNILLANATTYKKFDLYAQKHPNRIVTAGVDGNIETIETSNELYDGLSQFVTENYELECCIDYDLQEGHFTLIYDETPDFDGEPIEKFEEQEKVYTYRESA